MQWPKIKLLLLHSELQIRCVLFPILSFCQHRDILRDTDTFHSNSVMLWSISIKLNQDDHWPRPDMSHDFDPRLTFDLDIGAKNVT